jgi:hypothetical protein
MLDIGGFLLSGKTLPVVVAIARIGPSALDLEDGDV